MRLSKNTPVCGVDPAVARNVARECNFRDTDARGVAYKLKLTTDAARDILAALEDGGYLTEKTVMTGDGRALTQYATTVSGGALAQATFNKPISRKKAEELLEGVVGRAAQYNALPDKPLYVEEVTVFGSYLIPQVQELGDLDIHVTFGHRSSETAEPQWLLDYAYATDRRFNTIVDALGWGEREAILYLRDRSARISITTEDLGRLTDRKQRVYSRGSQAV
jgi:predicted nucleotidyltransferase